MNKKLFFLAVFVSGAMLQGAAELLSPDKQMVFTLFPEKERDGRKGNAH